MLAKLNNSWGLRNSPFNNNGFGELFKLFENLDRTNHFRHSAPNRTVEDRDKEIEIKLFLPGYSPKDFNIQAVSDFVTIKAARQPVELNADEHYLRQERSTMTYEETFSLPSKVVNNKVAAKYTDGVLTLTLPKQDVESPRLIKVK
jgi:HSP20 family protein